MIQDTLKPEIKNDIKNALRKHGLMFGDKYAAEILQELATEYTENNVGYTCFPCGLILHGNDKTKLVL